MTSSILSLIGHTPLVEITHFDTGPCRLFLKMESQNPGGSIKDRIALSMIEAAEKDGRLKPGGTIVEATAGNTGLGLALIGALKGYKVILVVPDKMAREKITHCKGLGAEVRLTRSDVVKGHPDYYSDMAARIAKETGAFFVNQFDNPANALAHIKTTGPEIREQMDGDIDAIVCGVGSGGTLAGLARYFAQTSPKTEMVLADPEGSILAPLHNTGKMITPGSWLVEGIGEDFIPANLDMKMISKAYTITDSESLSMVRELLAKEGILAGPSSGTLISAALQYCREQKSPKRVVTFVCDRGDKYLSKVFSDFWMTEQGLSARRPTGTIEDLIVRRHDEGGTTCVRPGDTLLTAYKRMRTSDVSQIPVIDDNDHILGVVYEKNLLDHSLGNNGIVDMNASAESIMRRDFPALRRSASMAEASQFLQENSYLVVTDGKKFVGLVTRIDMLNQIFLQKGGS